MSADFGFNFESKATRVEAVLYNGEALFHPSRATLQTSETYLESKMTVQGVGSNGNVTEVTITISPFKFGFKWDHDKYQNEIINHGN
ncbi:hypothetical protein [Vibrio cincinnatiensis]|uniref:hypothetical protein n=1 Tax=Vibrio cincinnatiensis TaxID=675 RepID=UPI001EDF3B7B|nr:hypothetical protein [Vibrio cincinnatiensis]MCG3723677.1 hypothetical protein [Vibrio cincinnatiensis]